MADSKYSEKDLKTTFGDDDFLAGYDASGSARYNADAIRSAVGSFDIDYIAKVTWQHNTDIIVEPYYTSGIYNMVIANSDSVSFIVDSNSPGRVLCWWSESATTFVFGGQPTQLQTSEFVFSPGAVDSSTIIPAGNSANPIFCGVLFVVVKPSEVIGGGGGLIPGGR